MFAHSIRVKCHIGTTSWELWGIIWRYATPLIWLPCPYYFVNLVYTDTGKLIKSCYAAHVLLLYWSFLNNWILLLSKLSSCTSSNSFHFQEIWLFPLNLLISLTIKGIFVFFWYLVFQIFPFSDTILK